jgi:Tfp pilus assembly protein PilF
VGLAVAFERQGDPARARQIFQAILGKNFATGEGQALLGDLLMEQKLYAEATRHYQEALRLKPDLAVAHNNLAWFLATSDDPRFRDPQAALEHALRAVDLSRWKEATFIDTLAEAYYANRNFQEAVKVQTKTLELDPHNDTYQDHMARYRKAAGG